MQQDLNYVYEIYKEKSFSRAAEKLYISQPALSIAVAKIEAEIGMPLFDRSTRPVSLTPAGQIYIDTIQKSKNLEQDMQQRLEDIRTLRSGCIVIGGSHYINSYILPSVLSGFNEKYPDILVELAEGSAYEMTQLLKNREIHLTFSCDPQILVQFEGFPVFSDTILVAVPADYAFNDMHQNAALSAEDILRKKHLLSECPVMPLADFEKETFILLREGNNLYQRAMMLFHEAGIDPCVKMKLSQLVTAFHLAESGYGATFISDRLIRTAESRLVFYKLDSEQIFRRFFLLINSQRYTSNAVKEFVAYMQEYMDNT